MSQSSFKDLRVWQEAMALTVEIYKCTGDFPKHEVYGLTQQIRRAAVSVPSNIAEGKGITLTRNSCDFCFMHEARLQEVQTQLLMAEQLQYLSEQDARRLTGMAEGVGRALSGLIASLREKSRVRLSS
jgi:four helix bundle protein